MSVSGGRCALAAGAIVAQEIAAEAISREAALNCGRGGWCR